MKRFLLLCICCALVVSLSAQSTWSLALEVGAGWSGSNQQEYTYGFSPTATFVDTWEENLAVAYNGGLLVDYRLNEYWQLGGSLSFQQLGAAASFSRGKHVLESPAPSVQSQQLAFRQNQLALPLRARYFPLGEQGSARPFLLFGGQAVRLLSSRLLVTPAPLSLHALGTELFLREENTTSVQQPSAFWSFSCFVGLGLQLNRLSIQLQYDWSAFPHGQVLYADRGLPPIDCYTCQFAERRLYPQLRQTSLRLSYRLF